MTALIVVRLMAKDPKVGDEMVTFSRRADRTVGSSSEVREGERLPVRELLYGLLLPSGNDAAVAFAEHFGGRLKPPAEGHARPEDPFARFIAEMNRVAAELGLHETHFENPNGLPAPSHRIERTRPGQAGSPRAGRARVRRGRLDPEARLHAGQRRGQAAQRRLDEHQPPARHRRVRRREDRDHPGRRHLPGRQRPSRPGPPDRRRPGRLELARQPLPGHPQPLPLGLADARPQAETTKSGRAVNEKRWEKTKPRITRIFTNKARGDWSGRRSLPTSRSYRVMANRPSRVLVCISVDLFV